MCVEGAVVYALVLIEGLFDQGVQAELIWFARIYLNDILDSL